MKARKKADAFSGVASKLTECDPVVQEYVVALKEENLKLQKEIADLQAQQLTLENRIRALEECRRRPSEDIECQDI